MIVAKKSKSGRKDRTPVIPVWTWRDAVRQTDVPPLTKLICYTLANYLADAGKGCWPTVETLMADSGLSNRSVATHLANAEAAGLITIKREVGNDGRFKGTLYLPRFPSNAALPRDPAGTDHVNHPHADRPSEEYSRGDADRVKETHADRPSEDPSPGPREPDDSHRVKEVHGNYPTELSNPPPPKGGRVGGSSFLDELKAEGQPQHVVDLLIGRLLVAGQRPWKDVDPLGPAREICKAGKPHSVTVIERAAEALLRKQRYVLPPVADCIAAIEKAAAEERVRLSSQASQRAEQRSESEREARLQRERALKAMIGEILDGLELGGREELLAAFAAQLPEFDRASYRKFGWQVFSGRMSEFLAARGIAINLPPETSPASQGKQKDEAA